MTILPRLLAMLPPAPRLARAARGVLAGLLAGALALPPTLAPVAEAQAQGRSLSIVRDAEIERLLADYARPIFRAAGISADATRIVLINDTSFNAFVADGRRIFINIGALMQAETPNEIIGVIAHETGHIAGGHLARLRQEVANAQILSIVGMMLGAGAMAGAVSGGSNVGNPGLGAAGIFSGSQEMVRRNLLSYQRSEEQAADVAAVRYLEATGQSPVGMITTFRRFADSGLFRSAAVDPYLMSHPLPAERISQLERLAAQSPYRDRRDPPALQRRHDLARAKLFGFVDSPESVLRRYPPHDTSAPSRYARAVVMHRTGRSREAVELVDGLIREEPGNAYFQELRGQLLLESARPQEAAESLRRAAQQSPGAPTIRVLYGQALIARGDGASLEEAVRQLERATRAEPEAPEPFRHLAMAYGRTGQIGLAELATAEYYMAGGDIVNGQTQAFRAMRSLVEGSPPWRRARDIYEFVPENRR
ncbi:M48 family metalloprotease [Salinarimonas chemoclinalis]|uniref:M48 family metalloprotease n=1 Tax=Salinarimonas chemoclinalis TaxID=3241599 RepID=UPI0035561256